MAQIIWSNAAVDDLQRLREYFAPSSPAFADRLLDQIINSTRRLAAFPQSGRIVPEFDEPTIREVLAGKYRIIYRLSNPDKVEIARVYHVSQSVSEL